MRTNYLRPVSADPPELVEDDFRKAMEDVDTFMDIHIHDLLKLYHLARNHAQLRYVEDVPVSKYMTHNVITIGPDKSLAEAARLFVVNNISGLPVINQTKNLLGILTEADLLAAIGLPCRHPTCGVWYRIEHLFKHETHIRGLAGYVGDMMYKIPVYTQEEKSLHQAIDLMKKKHVKKLIVTDRDDRVSGIITRGNIIKALLERGAIGTSPASRSKI